MAVAATRNVTGWLVNVSAEEIDGAVLRVNPDPSYVVASGGTIAVGTQELGKAGEIVVPIATDGSFTAPIIAADNADWTLTVTIDGPNVEVPLPSFAIFPPPATGSGDVTIDTLLAQQPSGNAPALVGAIRSMADYDDSTPPTDGQAIVWSASESKFKPGSVSGSGSGLPAGGTVGQFVRNTGSGTGTWQTVQAVDIGGVASDDARLTDARTPTAHASTHQPDGTDPLTGYMADDGSKTAAINAAQLILVYNETAATWPVRTTATSDVTRPVQWWGPVAPPIAGGYALNNVDSWVQTPPKTSS